MSKTPQELLSILNEELVALQLDDRAPMTDEVSQALSFDDLIVNSLDALQVVMRLEEASGREISLSELRRFPTIMDALTFLSAGGK